MSTDTTHQWVFLSVTTNKFIGINEFGKVCVEEECEGHCRFNIHGVSMPSAHLIIRLQNALNYKYFLQIDGPSPFQIDGYGGNAKQSKKSIFRYTSKVKNNQNISMLQSVRWGYYISVKSTGEIYINQYADNRSSFYRFRIPSNTPFNSESAFNKLPQFAKNIIVQNRIQNNIDIPVITNIKPSAPPAPFNEYKINQNNDINEEKEGFPSQLIDNSSQFSTLTNKFTELKINNNSSDHDNISNTLLLYGDDDENIKNRKFISNDIILTNKHNIYDTPYNKHSIFTSIITNKNINILPTGHITGHGSYGPFSRFIIKTISTKHIETHSNNEYDHIVIIQNIHGSEYLSMNNKIKQIEISKKYFDIATHWRIVVVKSETLNGMKIVLLQSCLNQQLLAVKNNGMITSLPLTSMESKNTQFILNTIEAKNFSFFQNFMNKQFLSTISQNIMNEVGKKINKFDIQQPYKGRSLTFEEKRFFYDFGFVIIKNAISPNVYKPAIQFINDGIKRREHLKGLGPFGLWSCRDRIILNLYFQSNVYSMVQSLLGQSVESLVPAAQIALRFPLSEKIGGFGKFIPQQKQLDGTGWHIDGMLLRNSTGIGKFSILCGIVLSEWEKEFMGNFTAYPKSHNIITQLLKQKGMESFMEKQNNLQTRYNFNELNKQIKPKQITASIGDIILCHPFLAHRVAPNYSHNIRYGIFMRPTRIDHFKYVNDMINKNMWSEYDGLNEIINYYNKINSGHKTSNSMSNNPYYNTQYQQQQQQPHNYRTQSYYQIPQQNIAAFNPNAYSQPVPQQYQQKKIPQKNNSKSSNTKYQKFSV